MVLTLSVDFFRKFLHKGDLFGVQLHRPVNLWRLPVKTLPEWFLAFTTVMKMSQNSLSSRMRGANQRHIDISCLVSIRRCEEDKGRWLTAAWRLAENDLWNAKLSS